MNEANAPWDKILKIGSDTVISDIHMNEQEMHTLGSKVVWWNSYES